MPLNLLVFKAVRKQNYCVHRIKKITKMGFEPGTSDTFNSNQEVTGLNPIESIRIFSIDSGVDTPVTLLNPF